VSQEESKEATGKQKEGPGGAREVIGGKSVPECIKKHSNRKLHGESLVDPCGSLANSLGEAQEVLEGVLGIHREALGVLVRS